MRKENIDDLVDAILDEFESEIKDWKKDVSLKSKNIQVANVEQASYLARYDEIRVNVKSLLDYYDMRVKEVRGKSLQLIIKTSDYAYSATERERLLDSDPNYLKYKRIYLEINEMYNMLVSIAEQFKNRAYTLNNLVKIHIASLQDITLDG
jgi:hypothetical protein